MMLKTQRQSGFSLLETLLVTGLIAVFILGLITVFDGWAERALNRKTAEQLLRLQNAAVQYVKGNYGALSSGVTGTFIPINIATNLANGVYLPTSYTATNLYRQSMRVYYRRFVIDGVSVYEVLTVSNDPSSTRVIRISNQNLRDISQAGGIKVGVISQMTVGGTAYSGRVASLFRDWHISYGGSINSLLTGFLGTPNAEGGYLAAYELIATDALEANERYLYRVDIPGKGHLNQMQADLRMNNQPLQNVGTMSADRVDVTGDMAVLGRNLTGVGNTLAMTIDQALRVNGTGEHRINMDTLTAGCGFAGTGNRSVTGSGCVITGGEIQVVSSADARLDIIGDLRLDGDVITDQMTVAGTTTVRGTSTFTNLNVAGAAEVREEIIAPTTYVAGNVVNTQELEAGDVTLYNTGTGFRSEGALVAVQLESRPASTITTTQLDLGDRLQTNELRVRDITVTRSFNADSLAVSNLSQISIQDTVANVNIRCTKPGGSSNPNIYCEPDGVSFHVWNGNTYERNCTIQSNGYTCNHWRTSGGPRTWLAECVHTRTTHASRATHSEPVCRDS